MDAVINSCVNLHFILIYPVSAENDDLLKIVRSSWVYYNISKILCQLIPLIAHHKCMNEYFVNISCVCRAVCKIARIDIDCLLFCTYTSASILAY